jgi:hypothetical protein
MLLVRSRPAVRCERSPPVFGKKRIAAPVDLSVDAVIKKIRVNRALAVGKPIDGKSSLLLWPVSM